MNAGNEQEGIYHNEKGQLPYLGQDVPSDIVLGDQNDSAMIGLDHIDDDDIDSMSSTNSEDSNPLKMNMASHRRNLDRFLPDKVPGLNYDKGFFTWTIDDLKSLKGTGKHMSEEFCVGSMVFKLLCTQRDSSAISLFLDGAAIDSDSLSDDDWSCPVAFCLVGWDPDTNVYHHQKTVYRYNKTNHDWGFNRFIDQKNSFGSAIFSKNSFNITAYVIVYDDYTNVLYRNLEDYDSKKSTGYIGIENQGATCYLNSLLQSYFFTLNFRDKVYQIPTEDEIKFDLASYRDYKSQPKSVPLSLQRIFYKLQTANQAIDSLELTQSFGWTTADAFEQHDVQELNRILMDRLETRMKGTEIDGCLNDIFVGKMNSFIRCVDVDYESNRSEDFWDIQLNVKGLHGIQQSFENYVALEMLDGDNKYDAGEFGLQNAEKGVIFESFPPVLHVQLKRYEYDFNYDQMVKINDRYEFTHSIDLKPYLAKSSSNYNENWEYELHGVLVHQGDVSVGHYYAMIKPSTEDKWFKFEDDRVVRVTPYQVFEENFGSSKQHIDTKGLTREEAQNLFWRQSTSAYMLVYIRKDKLGEILKPSDDNEIPEHIKKQIDYEHEHQLNLKKEREQMHLYANVHISMDSRFVNYNGFDIGPNVSNKITYSPDCYDSKSLPLDMKVLKSDPIDKLFELIAQSEYGEGNFDKMKLQDLRFWKMEIRENNTFRVSHPINCVYGKHEDVTIGDICKLTERRHYQGYQGPTHIHLYVEDLSLDLNFIFNSKSALIKNGEYPREEIIESKDFNDKINSLSKIGRADFNPSWETFGDNRHKLIFIKYFDELNQSIKGLGHMILKQETTFSVLAQKISFILDLPKDFQINFAEELHSDKIIAKDSDKTLYDLEIRNGDIICFNKPYDISNPEEKFKNLFQYYDFLSTRRHFKIIQNLSVDENEEDFIDLEENDDNEDGVENVEPVELDLWLSYRSSFKEIANEIGDLIGHDSNKLRLFYVEGNQKSILRSNFDFSYFAPTPQSNELVLAYEALNIPLKELEELKECTMYWVGNGICRDERHDFSIPRSTTIDSLLDRLQPKVQFTSNERKDLLIWTIDSNLQIRQVCPLDYPIEKDEFFVVGYYPEYTDVFQNGSSTELLVTGYHFFQSPENCHSLPFIFKLIKGESFTDMSIRLKQILGLSEKEFKNVHIGVANDIRVEYFDPKKPVEPFSVFQDGYSMVLNHPDRNARRGSFQSSIVIKG